jgi:hypothetical protein
MLGMWHVRFNTDATNINGAHGYYVLEIETEELFTDARIECTVADCRIPVNMYMYVCMHVLSYHYHHHAPDEAIRSKAWRMPTHVQCV